jgi:precorrin-6Y C5,15-methyltransferase (decarboxylating)
MTKICRIIGVLDDGNHSLSLSAIGYISHADVVIASTRLLEVMAKNIQPTTECLDLTGKLSQVSQWITEAHSKAKNVVVLATGDPLCHGIASYLIKQLGREKITVLPNLSAHQLACAKLGLAWQSCQIGSVHSQETGEWILGADPRHSLYKALQLIRQSALTALYTSPENNPNRIARMLQIEGLATQYELAVAACLLQKNEQLSNWMTVDEVATHSFNDLNIVLIRHRETANVDAIFGLPDERFKQRKPNKGLITKREVRAVSLARLSLQPDSIMWDIGAGSGSVGLEAARLCPLGHVYAIEKNTDDAAIALENKINLKVSNYSLLQSRAPSGMDGWLDPDAVFIGGSGGELQALILLCLKRLKHNGQLVMNFVTLENLNTAMTTLKAAAVQWDVVQLQATRSKPILSMQRMQAENPVWIVCATANSTETTDE